MWGYYVALALRSSTRSKALSALVIALLAFGVAACMVSYAVFRATTSDPLPDRSAHLYVPQIDNVGPAYTWHGEPPGMLSYIDASSLLAAHRAIRQTMLYPTSWQVQSITAGIPATKFSGDAVTADFFAMFELPFKYGAAWTAHDDDQHATTVVISSALNQQLFNGENSVGRELLLDGELFRIAGVLDQWNPQPRFFDLGSFGGDYAFVDVGDIYMPFNRATDMKKDSPSSCPTASGGVDSSHWSAYLNSECDRIDAWVELDSAAQVEAYTHYLHDYAEQQRRLGRFSWAANVRLNSFAQWMALQRVTPRAASYAMLISMSFLLIVLINVIGLMLARFMQRAPEIGVRRALGASRRTIYHQFLIEAAALGLLGGLFGIGLTVLGVGCAGTLFDAPIARLVHVDISLLGLTVLVAIVATLAAALYPTWRAAQTQPAWQIKVNG